MVRSVLVMAMVLATSTAFAHDDDDDCGGRACFTGGCFTGGCSTGHCGPSCGPTCGPTCAPTVCQKTVLVPEWYTELCTVKCTEYQHIQKHRTVTRCEKIPVKTLVPYEYTVCQTVWQPKLEKYCVQVPVWTEVEQTCYINVPYTVTKHGVRKVAKVIQVPKSYEVCIDKGCWQQQCTPVQTCGTQGCGIGGCGTGGCAIGGCGIGGCGIGGCGSCCPQPCPQVCCHKVWVPNIVKQVVNYTCCETICVEEPFEYQVTLCKKVPQVQKVKVCHYQTVEKTREVKCPVTIHVKKHGTREVCTWNTVHKSRVENYTVCVPVCIEKQVPVKKCRMVCKVISCPCPPAPCCQTACHVGCGRGCGECDD